MNELRRLAVSMFRRMLSQGDKADVAAKRTAKHYGVSARSVYRWSRKFTDKMSVDSGL